MFSSKAKPLSSPSRVSIEEANSHLKLVHQRVEQLETIVAKQTDQLVANEDNYKQELNRLSQTYDKHVFELNAEMDFLNNKIKDLDQTVIKQKIIIEENGKQMEKLSQILKLTPNLDKLVKLLNSLVINNNNNNNNNYNTNANKISYNSKLTERLNGFCDNSDEISVNTIAVNSNISSDKILKKSVKYKTDDQFIAEEPVSTTSSSTTTTAGQSPANGQTASTGSSTAKKSNSKLRFGRSFNITSNFSDEEEVADHSSSSRRKKSSIH